MVEELPPVSGTKSGSFPSVQLLINGYEKSLCSAKRHYSFQPTLTFACSSARTSMGLLPLCWGRVGISKKIGVLLVVTGYSLLPPILASYKSSETKVSTHNFSFQSSKVLKICFTWSVQYPKESIASLGFKKQNKTNKLFTGLRKEILENDLSI